MKLQLNGIKLEQEYLDKLDGCSIWYYKRGTDDWYVAEYPDGEIVELETFFKAVAEQFCELRRRAAEEALRPLLNGEFFDGEFSKGFETFGLDAAFANLALAIWVWRHGAYPYSGGTVSFSGMGDDALDANRIPVPFAMGHVGDIIFSPQELIARLARKVTEMMYSTKLEDVKKVKERGPEAVSRLVNEIKKSVETYNAQFEGKEPETAIPPVAIGMAQLEAVRELLSIA